MTSQQERHAGDLPTGHAPGISVTVHLQCKPEIDAIRAAHDDGPISRLLRVNGCCAAFTEVSFLFEPYPYPYSVAGPRQCLAPLFGIGSSGPETKRPSPRRSESRQRKRIQEPIPDYLSHERMQLLFKRTASCAFSESREWLPCRYVVPTECPRKGRGFPKAKRPSPESRAAK